ncbi:MAG: hypothetical protein ACI4MM_05610 [Candidatus Ventricola sp.]
MDRVFVIGDFCFRLICPDSVTPPENFMLFARDAGEPSYIYTLELSDSFPQPRGRMIAQRPDLAVFEQDGLEMRYIGVAGAPGFYACYREEDARSATILLASAATGITWVDPMFLALFAMERRMMNGNALVLHCAYMEREGEAILFSAPSGTGKTTQATLWEKHRGTRVVNGDKALIRCADGAWTANGWPVCGSSQVCHDETMPIRAIVMLSQGKENTIERLAPFAAFSRIYSQVTINFWNRDAQQRAMDLIERLVTQIPVYHLSCTISEEAVACLEDVLRKAK